MTNYKLEKDGFKKTIYAVFNRASLLIHFYNLDFNKSYLLIDQPLKLKEIKYGINPNLDQNVLDFAEKMEAKYDSSNLNSMYHNLRNLRVYNKIKFKAFFTNPISFLTGSIGGSYDIFLNDLCISSKDNIGSFKTYILEHELFHLATTNSYSNQSFSGFSQVCKLPFGAISIGNGLNEGYTEYMTHDLNGKSNINKRYYALRESMDILVKVLGREKMNNYYFHNNLKNLRDDIAKYSSLTKANSFILDLDKFLLTGKGITKITDYLDILYRTKLNEDLLNDDIDLDYVNDEVYYLSKKIEKINTLVKFQKMSQYLDYMRQYEPNEVEETEYIREKYKEKKLIK